MAAAKNEGQKRALRRLRWELQAEVVTRKMGISVKILDHTFSPTFRTYHITPFVYTFLTPTPSTPTIFLYFDEWWGEIWLVLTGVFLQL